MVPYTVPLPLPPTAFHLTYSLSLSPCLQFRVSFTKQFFTQFAQTGSFYLASRYSYILVLRVYIKTCRSISLNRGIVYSSLGIPWASSLLGFIAAALAPVPWVFFRYGPTLRKKSSYDKEFREPGKARLREGYGNEVKTPNGNRQLEF